MGNITIDNDAKEDFAAMQRAARENGALAPLPGETIAGWWIRFEELEKRQWGPEDAGLFEVLGVVTAVCRHLEETYDVVLASDCKFYPCHRGLLN